MSEPDATELPRWLATENDVRSIFMRLGFRVENISISGRQIDLVAQRIDRLALVPQQFVVEITTERVGATKGGTDTQKLLLAKQQQPNATLLLISTQGFTDDQAATLKQLGITPLTYADFESTALNLGQYASVSIAELRRTPENDVGFDPDVFVDPTLNVNQQERTGLDWVKSILNAPVGGTGALLGNLGTGKTSLIRKAQLELLLEYEKNPSSAPIPIYIPLARYKHHSGKLDGLLLEVLQEAGVGQYPVALVRELLRLGRIVLLLDGLDEIHPLSTINDVVDTAQNILDYIGKSGRAIISARAHLFSSSTEELAIFGPYEKQQVLDVAASLRKLLAGRTTTEIAYIQPFSYEQTSEYLRRACGVDFDLIQKQIDSIYGFRDLARTPVLLAMMRRTLPKLALEKHRFSPFPQVDLYKAYTERWLERDSGRAKLSTIQREQLSLTLAIRLLAKDEYSAPWNEIVEILKESPDWENSGVPEQAAEADIRNSTFLVREDDRRFRFAHRSIMEFLAAQWSLQQLHGGHSLDAVITDGHSLFLSMLAASEWLEAGGQIRLPTTVLNISNDLHRRYFGLIASAGGVVADGTHLVAEGFRISGQHPEVNVVQRTEFRRTEFQLESVAGLNFSKCEFRACRFAFKDIVMFVRFENSSLESTSLEADLATWAKVEITPRETARIEALGVHVGYLSASRFVANPGCRAIVDGMEWRLPIDLLDVLADFQHKFERPKITETRLGGGAHGPRLVAALPRLERVGFVEKDSSRLPHQYSIGARARTLIGALTNNRMTIELQTELLAAFEPA